MNELPEFIEALKYKEHTADGVLSGGILMVDHYGEIICRLTRGTIQDKKIALLFQASIDLLKNAKEACETTRAFYDRHYSHEAPTWLAELEAAVEEAEKGELR